MSDLRWYRDLVAWQKSMAVAKRVYELTRGFPREEVYGMTSQIRRAAVSVPANIAEGHARQTRGEFRQFVGIARGSLAELETMLLLAKDLEYSDAYAIDLLLEACLEVGRLLNGLLRSLRRT